jgi:chromate transporter
MLLGLLRGGFIGLMVAGCCFIVPAVLIILPLAWLYVIYGEVPSALPILTGIGAVVAAIVAVVAIRLIRSTMRSASAVTCGILAFGLSAIAALGWGPVHGRFQPELVSLGIAACWGWISSRRRIRSTQSELNLPGLVLLPATAASTAGLGAMALFFLKVGATLFGSGYVLVSYLQSGLVGERGWLTQRQLVDAIAVGQFTPGPLLTTATFVGYLLGSLRFAGGVWGGIEGGVIATAAIFAPSFVLVALLGPSLQRIRLYPPARAALNGMNAAVAGLLAAVAMRLIAGSIHDQSGVALINAIIIAGAMIALGRGINATWLIVLGALAGWLASLAR